MSQPRKVLVTGAAGFIGSTLVERLLAEGRELVGCLFADEAFEGVVHLAALAGVRPSLERPAAYADVNVHGTAVVLVSVLEIVKRLEEELGVSARIDWLPRQIGDVSRTWADVTAAREALGYAPRVGFEEGIARFVRWLDETL